MYLPNAVDPLWEYLFMKILKEWYNVYVGTDLHTGRKGAEFVNFYLETYTCYLLDIE